MATEANEMVSDFMEQMTKTFEVGINAGTKMVETACKGFTHPMRMPMTFDDVRQTTERFNARVTPLMKDNLETASKAAERHFETQVDLFKKTYRWPAVDNGGRDFAGVFKNNLDDTFSAMRVHLEVMGQTGCRVLESFSELFECCCEEPKASTEQPRKPANK